LRVDVSHWLRDISDVFEFRVTLKHARIAGDLLRTLPLVFMVELSALNIYYNLPKAQGMASATP